MVDLRSVPARSPAPEMLPPTASVPALHHELLRLAFDDHGAEDVL
jgi:hypothetical protein